MLEPGGLIDFLITATAAPAGARRALILLALLAALLSAFVFIVALITALRRRARREARKAGPTAENLPDPWKESAKRIEP